ncbi:MULTISPECIES: hypothetical protein [Sphingobium]|uniref:hypothetical protein n=1 Tax=Sphingobium TaxID=165695 RepID=UPI00159C0891|nr:hypothetical protein [Sphingobium sp. 15-1]
MQGASHTPPFTHAHLVISHELLIYRDKLAPTDDAGQFAKMGTGLSINAYFLRQMAGYAWLYGFGRGRDAARGLRRRSGGERSVRYIRWHMVNEGNLFFRVKAIQTCWNIAKIRVKRLMDGLQMDFSVQN